MGVLFDVTSPDVSTGVLDVTIRGVSKPETLKLTLSGKGTGSGTIEGTMAFDRKEYGMNSGIPFIKVADRVEVTVNLKGERVSGPPVTFKQQNLLNGDTLHKTKGEEQVEKDGKTLGQRAYHEFKEFLVIVLYLWVVLGLFLLYKSVLLNEEHISFLAKGFAIINALMLGKIILIARALHIGDWTNRWPLIYPTVVKSALFSIVLALFKLLEAAVVALYRHQPFQQTITEFGGGTTKGILTLTLLMFVVLIPFCGFTELQRVMGKGKLAQIFFGLRESRGESTNQLELSSKA